MKIQQLTVGMLEVCCYIVSCEETGIGVIIDPGGNEERILAACRADDLQVKYIIATHAHPDHVCGNAKIKEATGAEIIMHEAEADFIADPQIAEYFSMLGLDPSPPADIRVKEGDVIAFGNEKLEVIHTPGHTPGGICLHSAPNLFTGDTLFVGGVGRTDFPGGNTGELRDSIRRLLDTLPPETVIWPGHGYGGDTSTLGVEARSNPFL